MNAVTEGIDALAVTRVLVSPKMDEHSATSTTAQGRVVQRSFSGTGTTGQHNEHGLGDHPDRGGGEGGRERERMPGMLGGAGRRGRAGARHHRDVHHHRVRGAAVAAGAAGRRPAAVCGWGEEPEWQPGTVVSSTPEAEGLRGLLVEVGEALSQGYDKPGQFVQLKVGDSKPAFIAIACPPAEAQAGQLELLIKDGDGTAGLLCGLEAGAAMDVSPVRSACGRAGGGGGLTDCEKKR